MSRPLSSPLQRVLAPCRPGLHHLQHTARLSPCARTSAAGIISISKRHQSTAAEDTPELSALDAASSLLARFQGKTHSKSQMLDGNQLQKLSLTLGRREIHPGINIEARAPRVGTLLPPGYHLVYFTPDGVEQQLGPDGSDVVFNAPKPFTRRMWAGGRMRWLGEDVALRVGDEAEERTKLVDATPKRSGSGGGEMILVQVEKQFWGPRGLALVDERSWIFRREATGPSPEAKKALHDAVIYGPSTMKDEAQKGAYPLRHLRWSPTGLFRFSALTFNGHKIHYDPTWCATVEGHPASVVHGPLNLISMLDYWRDRCAAGKRVIREIRYRAVAPVYAGETYEIASSAVKEAAEEDGGLRWELDVRKDSKTCMTGNILGE
ncbi:hypothetical protein F4803DRAFT_526926 [Xylaria telfairii]|nr:hypothetical protein F4803DRAFT_526926 [Xylaria telfairii]